jgi:hypothetical protein
VAFLVQITQFTNGLFFKNVVNTIKLVCSFGKISRKRFSFYHHVLLFGKLPINQIQIHWLTVDVPTLLPRLFDKCLLSNLLPHLLCVFHLAENKSGHLVDETLLRDAFYGA